MLSSPLGNIFGVFYVGLLVLSLSFVFLGLPLTRVLHKAPRVGMGGWAWGQRPTMAQGGQSGHAGQRAAGILQVL